MDVKAPWKGSQGMQSQYLRSPLFVETHDREPGPTRLLFNLVTNVLLLTPTAPCFLFTGPFLKVGASKLGSFDYLPYSMGALSHAIRLRNSWRDPLPFAGFFLPTHDLYIHRS